MYFVVQPEKKIKVLSGFRKKYFCYYSGILLCHLELLSILCASNSEKAVQINVQEGYHTVLGARFVSLVNQVPYCLGNILHTTIILNPGNTTARNLNIVKQRLGD